MTSTLLESVILAPWRAHQRFIVLINLAIGLGLFSTNTWAYFVDCSSYNTGSGFQRSPSYAAVLPGIAKSSLIATKYSQSSNRTKLKPQEASSEGLTDFIELDYTRISLCYYQRLPTKTPIGIMLTGEKFKANLESQLDSEDPFKGKMEQNVISVHSWLKIKKTIWSLHIVHTDSNEHWQATLSNSVVDNEPFKFDMSSTYQFTTFGLGARHPVSRQLALAFLYTPKMTKTYNQHSELVATRPQPESVASETSSER